MPKDWELHKAEIKRLYMVERRPLNDVRIILRTQFAFDASIRAYRMKLDEWQLWKNNSKNDRRAAKTSSRRHQSHPAIEISDSDDPIPSAGVTAARSSLPVDSSMAPSDIEQLSGFSKTIYGISRLGFPTAWELEQILREWKSDGSYLEGTLKTLDDKRSRFCIYWRPLQGTTLFQSIAANVAPFEKYPLAKRCLEIDFEQGKKRNFECIWEYAEVPKWYKLWRRACASHKWEDVVKYAHIIDQEPEGPGSLFTSTALPFLAEKLLERNLAQLEYWDPGDDRFMPCLRESMTTLRSFKTDTFDVDKIWYKRFVHLDQSRIPQFGKSDQLEDYRKTLLRIKMLHDSIDQSDDPVQSLLSAANGNLAQSKICAQFAHLSVVLKETKVILDALLDEDLLHPISLFPVGQPTSSLVQPENPSNVSGAVKSLVEDMYKKWSWDTQIRDNVIDAIKQFQEGVTSPPALEENIFVQISQHVPARDRICFTADILAVIDTRYVIFSWTREMDWASWLSIHDIANLKDLQATLKFPDLLQYYFDVRLEPVPINLILNAIVLLAARLALSTLRDIILRRLQSGENYDKLRYRYTEILYKLQVRAIQVDQKWIEFLGWMSSWDTLKARLLEDSEEASEVSDNDSTDSEGDG